MMARASGAVTPGGVASPDVLEASVPGAGKRNGDDDKAHRLVLEVKLDRTMRAHQLMLNRLTAYEMSRDSSTFSMNNPQYRCPRNPHS